MSRGNRLYGVSCQLTNQTKETKRIFFLSTLVKINKVTNEIHIEKGKNENFGLF